MWQFLSRGSNKGEHRKDPAPTTDNTEEKDDGFPTPDGCLMIFGGSAAYDSKRLQKVAHAVNSTWPNRPHLPSSDGRSPP